jgi:hypothetical protein
MKADLIGWVATAVFASSYFCRQPIVLRRVQSVGALLWVVYGTLIHALPVIGANILVASIAIWSSFAGARQGPPAPRDL